jgi:hypothetical protein
MLATYSAAVPPDAPDCRPRSHYLLSRRTCQARARICDLPLLSKQLIRVSVERRRSGCGTWLAIVILLGLAIEYWYISLALIAILIAIALLCAARQRELARRRPGPRDPWLNEVAVALADLGLAEHARNTTTQLGGAPLEGDIGFPRQQIRRLRELIRHE